MSLSFNVGANARTFDKFTSEANVVEYRNVSPVTSEPNAIRFARTLPKPTKTFAGVERTVVKTTTPITLADGTITVAVMTTEASVPVGAVQAVKDNLLSCHKNVLGNAVENSLLNSQLLPSA